MPQAKSHLLAAVLSLLLPSTAAVVQTAKLDANAEAILAFGKDLQVSTALAMQLDCERAGVAERLTVLLRKKPRGYKIVSDVEEDWCDHGCTWHYFPAAKTWERIRTRDGKDVFLSPSRILPLGDYFRPDFPFHVREKPTNGVFEGKKAALAKVETDYGFIRCVIAVDPSSHCLLGWTENEHGVIRTVRVLSLKFNPPLKDDATVFRPPAHSKEGSIDNLSLFLQQGTIFPDVALPDQSGRLTRLSKICGKRGTIVTFGYVTCGPCIAETRFLRSKYSALRRQGISVVAVNAVDPPKDVRSFAKKEKLPWLFLISGDSPLIRSTYRVAGAPTCYVLDERRRVVFAAQGFDDKTMKAVLAAAGMRS